MISPDLKYFYYATKNSIFKLNIESGKIEELIKFMKEMKKVEISNDCNNCVSTDLKILFFYQFDSRNLIGKIYKEKFNSYTIYFEKSKLCLASDICINIVDYSKEDDEKFIWLNLNPERFKSFKFSPDFSVLLAKIDEHNAIIYNCMNGRVIKKWCNYAKKWSIACEMVPETSEIAVVAT
jgi:WD40 repeat protein